MADLSKYDEAISAAAAVYPDVPPAWIRAVIGAETSFQNVTRDTWEPKANEYAYGPMQVLGSTARGLGFAVSPAELRTPAVNILVGAALIRQLRELVGDDFARMYSAYNSGNPDRYLSSPTVAGNVDRALTWLSRFSVEAPAAAGAGVVALVILGVLWLGRHVKVLL